MLLPFENPFHISSILADAHYNPANNVVRVMTVILAPTALFSVVYAISGKFRASCSFAPRNASRASVPRGGYGAIVLVALCCAMPLRAYLAEEPMYDSFHEGESMGAAVSYNRGQIPFRDVIALHGLIQDPLRSSAAFSLFGKSIGAVRSFESILKLFVWAALGAVILQLFRGRLLLAVPALFFTALLSYLGMLTLMQRELPVLLTLFALLLLYERIQERKPLMLAAVLAGFAPVFGLIYSLERGIFSFVIAVFGFGGLLLLASGRRRQLLLPAGAGAAVGLLALALLLRWDVGAHTYGSVSLICRNTKTCLTGWSTL